MTLMRSDYPWPGDVDYAPDLIPGNLRIAADWIAIMMPLEQRIKKLIELTRAEDNRVRMRAIQLLEKMQSDGVPKGQAAAKVKLTLESVLHGTQDVGKDEGVMEEEKDAES